MNAITLTATQRETLEFAVQHTDGRIEWFPASVKGGAIAKVLQGLLTRELIAEEGGHHVVTDAGYAALGRKRPTTRAPKAKAKGKRKVAASAVTAAEAQDDLEQEVAAAEASWAKASAEPDAEAESADPAAEPAAQVTREPRSNSKQAQVIALLRRPEGATIDEIRHLTGWQAHTVRGAFAGTFKKRLGLNVVSEKSTDDERVYRIVEAEAEAEAEAESDQQPSQQAEAIEGEAA
ncbi:DUF3489 domain-containing protein [Caldimonas brevitalea]|uniref:DUF3489 domain-containing protein n=1 Tax=Caldimonas brevitalea TaxID=413882 RepID=A0A0G3BVW4_9BURK|nr:DUF3489 domain-containing protein [Caldimonas brevitalea]AKJ30670.1 hypothetical protein AAW51_3979 [Caldimonas brevitalea]